MPRCKNRTRKDKKTGKCVSNKQRSRCPNGMRKNTKTNRCETQPTYFVSVRNLEPAYGLEYVDLPDFIAFVNKLTHTNIITKVPFTDKSNYDNYLTKLTMLRNKNLESMDWEEIWLCTGTPREMEYTFQYEGDSFEIKFYKYK